MAEIKHERWKRDQLTVWRIGQRGWDDVYEDINAKDLISEHVWDAVRDPIYNTRVGNPADNLVERLCLELIRSTFGPEGPKEFDERVSVLSKEEVMTQVMECQHPEAKRVSRVDELTQAQLDRIPEWVDKWTKIGLCTDPIDQKEVETAIRECYKLSNLEQPKHFIFLDSPLACILAIHLLHDPEATCPEVQAKVAPMNSVDVEKMLMERGKDPSKPKPSDCLNAYVGGQFWVSWQAFESYFDIVCGLDHAKLQQARAYRRAQQSCCWWWPYSEFVVVSNRPSKIISSNRQLHCEDGPGLQYRDGWSVWAIEGVRVTEQIVLRPETLTIPQIQKEDNAEVRRVMIQRYGASKYLEESGAEMVHVDQRTVKGGACRMLVKDANNGKWLVVTDGSTGRTYHLPVPEAAMTCHEAHNSIAGMNEQNIIAES